LTTSIHPSAIVERGAEIGRDVEIGPYSVVGSNVVLGDGCRLHHHATVVGHTTLGPKCEVYPQAILGTPPQDLKFRGERTTLEIGAGNIFREMVTVHTGTGNGGGVTKIGDNNFFLLGVHIAHDCQVGNRCVLANYVQLAGHVHLQNNVNIGGHSAVHHFVTIGRHAFIGGITRVPADVPPFVVMVAARGTRSEIRMINGVGLQRSGFTNDEIQTLKTAYMRLFSRKARQSGTAIRDRVEQILGEKPCHALTDELCQFLLRSFAHGRNGRYLESLRADPVHRNSWKLGSEYTLTVNVVGHGSVQRKPAAGDNRPHPVLELRAMADPGWKFSAWDGSLSGKDNPQAVVLDSNKRVDALFVRAL
jgi:UDP-N-acetylglucosamine acyltransferase